MRIALARDGSRFGDQVAELLRSQGGELVSLSESKDALSRLRAAVPDLLVIAEPFFAAGLPTFLGKLRRDPVLRPIHVLCVSAGASIDDGVACLEAGADDFIYRPFHAQIFQARVRTLLRRRLWAGRLKDDASRNLRCGTISIDLLQRQAHAGATALTLTRLEFDLLAYLVRRAGQVLERGELLTAVWNYPHSVETRTLDKHVEVLRRKLGQHGAAIETIHGVGYRLALARKAAR